MKRKALAIVLTLLMLVSVLPMGAFAASYTDTEGHWAEKSIDRWTDAKVLEGMGNNTFAPDEYLTRAQAMTIFSRLLNLTEKGDISKLTDVAADAWYAPYIETGYAYQIIKGTSDTTFDPSGNITREQFFSVFARAVGIPPASTCDKTFTDLDQVSSWFVEEGTVYSMINRGYLNGYPDGSLKPQQYITRAEVAKVLDNAISDYITEDGTYPVTGDGIVVVLAKNVKLTGNNFTGHIVSSCPDSTLDLSGLTGTGRNNTPYIYVLGDNTKIVNAKPGTQVAVNPAADNVTANGVKVTYNPYVPSNPYIVPAPGGGGSSNTPGSTTMYNVKLSLNPPKSVDQDGVELGVQVPENATLPAVMKALAGDKTKVESAVSRALNRMKNTTSTYEDASYKVEVVGDATGTSFTVTMLDKTTGDYVDIMASLNHEYGLYTRKLSEKAKDAGLTDADVETLSKALDPAKFFGKAEDNGVKLIATPADFADLYADIMNGVADIFQKVSPKAPDTYASLAKAWTNNNWAGEKTIFGTNFANLDSIMKSDKPVAAMVGTPVSVSKEVKDAETAKALAAMFTGRDYKADAEYDGKVDALLNGIFQKDGKNNFKGTYAIEVTVTKAS